MNSNTGFMKTLRIQKRNEKKSGLPYWMNTEQELRTGQVTMLFVNTLGNVNCIYSKCLFTTSNTEWHNWEHWPFGKTVKTISKKRLQIIKKQWLKDTRNP